MVRCCTLGGGVATGGERNDGSVFGPLNDVVVVVIPGVDVGGVRAKCRCWCRWWSPWVARLTFVLAVGERKEDGKVSGLLRSPDIYARLYSSVNVCVLLRVCVCMYALVCSFVWVYV